MWAGTQLLEQQHIFKASLVLRFLPYSQHPLTLILNLWTRTLGVKQPFHKGHLRSSESTDIYDS